MGKRDRLIHKPHKKQVDKKCFFCGNEDYCTLDVHRIVPGSDGGKYTEHNTVTSCSNCHRKIHDGKIKIDRKYPSTKGWLLHYFDEEGYEHWD
jgi:5-methylcytosine-specific restriction endonuclease McrA